MKARNTESTDDDRGCHFGFDELHICRADILSLIDIKRALALTPSVGNDKTSKSILKGA